MDLLFRHDQKKVVKKFTTSSQCILNLYSNDSALEYQAMFEFDYNRYGKRMVVVFEHNIHLNLINGDIDVIYKIINDGITEEKMFRTTTKQKKNDFKLLFDAVENGIARGEKRRGFWGVKYERAIESVSELIIEKLQPKFNSKFNKEKNYKLNHVYNSIYDILVDYHLDMKEIKSHDNVYFDIQHDYPKKKWLEKNENKFLPAVLDYYGIKTKYLLNELNKGTGKSIQISTLNYLCKLFGDNYLDYIKQIVWESHCYDVPPNKKIHKLKNDSEKKCMVSVIKKWETDTLKTDSLIYSVNKLLSIRDLLENKGLDLKFKAKNDNDFDNLMEIWSGIKWHFARGYKVRYTIPKDFVNMVEQDIVIDNQIFKPKILLTEEEFRVEGYMMKNCMSKQFPHGVIYIYVALQSGRKRINLQYRKGNLVQSYGKANTPVNDEIFQKASDILSERFKENTPLEWKKEKYDILTN
jgi:hypothetical protein